MCQRADCPHVMAVHDHDYKHPDSRCQWCIGKVLPCQQGGGD